MSDKATAGKVSPFIVFRSRGVVYALVVIYLSMFGMTAAAISYANHVGRQTGQQFCSIIVIQDDNLKSHPPQTPDGKKYAAEFAKLRKELRCR